MPQSPILPLLTKLQADTNNLTVTCIGLSSRLSDIIELFDDNFYSQQEISIRTINLSRSLEAMFNALEKFDEDGSKLKEYLDAQG